MKLGEKQVSSTVSELGPHRILSSGSMAPLSMTLRPISIGTMMTFGQGADVEAWTPDPLVTPPVSLPSVKDLTAK